MLGGKPLASFYISIYLLISIFPHSGLWFVTPPSSQRTLPHAHVALMMVTVVTISKENSLNNETMREKRKIKKAKKEKQPLTFSWPGGHVLLLRISTIFPRVTSLDESFGGKVKRETDRSLFVAGAVLLY